MIYRPPHSFVIVRVPLFSQKIICSMRGQSTLMFVTTLFEVIAHGDIVVSKVSTHDNPVDVMTQDTSSYQV